MKSEAEVRAALQLVSAYVAAGCCYSPLSRPSQEACAMLLFTLQWMLGVGEGTLAADLLGEMEDKLRQRKAAS